MKSELKIIKIGGKIISDNKILQKYINRIKNINENIILIHGGGNIANQYFSKHNLPIKMFNGRRITDKKSLDVLVMLYAGIINKNLVSKLNNSNNNFIGLSGADSKVIISDKRKVENIDYGYVGDIKSIDSEFIKKLIKSKTYPVFCPITYDNKGSLLNTKHISVLLFDFSNISISPMNTFFTPFLIELNEFSSFGIIPSLI